MKRTFPPNHHGNGLFPVLSFMLVMGYVASTFEFWSGKRQTVLLANKATRFAKLSPAEFCQTLDQLQDLSQQERGKMYNSSYRILGFGGLQAIETGLRWKPSGQQQSVLTATATLCNTLAGQRAVAKRFAQDPVLCHRIVQSFTSAVDEQVLGSRPGAGNGPALPLLRLVSQLIPHYPFGRDTERDDRLRTAIALLSQDTATRLGGKHTKTEEVLRTKSLLVETAFGADSHLQHTASKEICYNPIISHLASLLLPMAGEGKAMFTEVEEIYLLLAFADKLWGNSKAYTNDHRLQGIFSFTRAGFQFAICHAELLLSLCMALSLGYAWGAIRTLVAMRSLTTPASFGAGATTEARRLAWMGTMAHLQARRASVASFLVTLDSFDLTQHRSVLQSDWGQTVWHAAKTGIEMCYLRVFLLTCPYFILPCAITALVAAPLVERLGSR
ncbi:hypothetical protein BASA81_001473 [Batrachochytrium salamandrivorans]|nr:hypothetical protein BASA81_001473 [Batrachochytrium salamandrivorans]